MSADEPAADTAPGLTYAAVCGLASRLPGMEQSTSYGTPALKVAGRLVVRLKEDGETIVLHTDPVARDILLSGRPDMFFITDHYRGAPYVLVRLAAAERSLLEDLLEDAWRSLAPPRLVRDADEAAARNAAAG